MKKSRQVFIRAILVLFAAILLTYCSCNGGGGGKHNSPVPNPTPAVNSPWVWMSGSNLGGQNGIYGTKGVPGAANIPGARYSAVSWIDAAGNFWLFGGTGNAASGGGLLNDLWRWDGANWTWMSGSTATNQNGVYGTKGASDPANVPGARDSAVSWKDVTGNFWLFGGNGYDASGSSGVLNDLWKWDGANWTWISGSNAVNQSGVYGSKGAPVPANVPGARKKAVSWTDAAGNFWLFGGLGLDASGSVVPGDLNDLWKWDGVNWTWMSGSNATFQTGVYGAKGVADPANVPGARYGAVSWTNTAGNFWLFGGIRANMTSDLNDLWRWDGVNWTWISGSNATDQSGIYGIMGVPNPVNVPGARGYAVSWKDAAGNLWLFGGIEMLGLSFWDSLNDLWRWDGVNWTWMRGSNLNAQKGVYGTKGAPGPGSVPGARGSAISWNDAAGNLWLFGGDGYAAIGNVVFLNDLWRYHL